MADLRKISAVFILLVMMLPLLSLSAVASNIDASSIYNVYNDAVKRGGTYKAALMDADFFDSEDGCLTKTQETMLLNLMEETADKIHCNIGIVITNDLHKMTDTRYVRNFHDAMFGEYSDSISLLLLNSHDYKPYDIYEDQIYYTDRGFDLFDKRLDSIFNRIYKAYDRDPNDIYGMCVNFCGALKSYGTGFGAFATKLNISAASVLAALVAGTVVSLIVVSINTSGYKKKAAISAAHYIDTSRTRIDRQVDAFVREYTTSVRIQSSSGGSRGGGGGGGGHRSGGGGGRHR